MGKLIPLLFAGAGATTASVGGFYLVKGNGLGTSGDFSSNVPNALDTVDAFKLNVKKPKCVKDYFGDIANNVDAPLIDANSPGSNTFFKSAAPEFTDSHKSCLSMNGEIRNYTPDEK